MKITKAELRQIIKEELEEVLDETEEVLEASEQEQSFEDRIQALIDKEYGPGAQNYGQYDMMTPDQFRAGEEYKARQKPRRPRTEKEKRYGIYPGKRDGPGSLGS